MSLRVAGPPVRFLAWAIDTSIRSVAYFVLALPLMALDDLGSGLLLLVLFAGEWFYPVIFEVKLQGATLGKRWLGIQVLHDNGTPVGWAASVLRNLIRFADFLPVAYGLGLGSMLMNRDFKRLGDLAAGTVVVYRDSLPSAAGVPEAPAIPPPVGLTLEEQRILFVFAERLAGWSEERGMELAGLVEPLTDASGRDGVARLVGMGNWLVGRR